MTIQHSRFPSIEQLRTVVKHVRDRSKFHQIPIPTLKFQGTVKIHGTNSSIIFNPQTKETWCQSREQIITPEKDNSGFARFVSEFKNNEVNVYFNIAAGIFGMNYIKPGDLIGIYGEWCGQGIMKGVAISQVPKRFVIFGIKVFTPKDETDEEDFGTSLWFSPDQLVKAQDLFDKEIGVETNIYSIQHFKTWNVEIDFMNPELIQNQLIEFTNQVEQECPVGKAFGVSGIGEGIVYRSVGDFDKFKTSDLVFKVKGEKHSVSKVKKLAPIDIEKLNSVNEFVESVVTENRLEQMIEKMKETGIEVDIKNTGAFLKLIGNDVLKEESDTLEASNLDRTSVMPVVNKVAKQWFMKRVFGDFS